MPGGSKLWACFPCIPAKQQNPTTPDPNNPTSTETQDEQDQGFWQDGTRTYSKRQICKGVAIVLSGYDIKSAAGAIDPTCDPNTVNLWVQLYTPPFFEDGMLCPPALIMWWMNEMDRKNKLVQSQTLQQQQQQQFQQPPSQGPIQPIVYNGPVSQSGGGVPNSSVFGTSYLKVPFMTPDGTIISQTVTTPAPTGNPNSIVISSSAASQPNVKVYYQDQSNPLQATALQPQQQQPQPQRPNSVPQAVQPVSYDALGRPFQAQLTRVQTQQQKEAEEALSALQAQVQSAQDQQQQQQQQQRQGPSRPPRGPPYQLLN